MRWRTDRINVFSKILHLTVRITIETFHIQYFRKTPFNQIQEFLFCFVLPAIEHFKNFYVDLSVFPLVKKLKHSKKKKLKIQSPQKKLNPEFHRQCSACAISSAKQRHCEHEGAWVGGPLPAQVRGGAAR